VNVSGPVDEQITRILIPAIPAREWAAYAVDDAAAIGMEEAARQSARMAGHDLLLPRFEFDAAHMMRSFQTLFFSGPRRLMPVSQRGPGDVARLTLVRFMPRAARAIACARVG
jgi:hypothetical protein